MPDTKKSVYFNSGEAVSDGDMNNLQFAMQVTHGDYGLAKNFRDTNFISEPTVQTVYAAPGALQGCIRAHPSTANLVTNYGGTIYLRESTGSSIDGQTPRLLTYQLSDAELDTAITPDPSLPRWVGIFIKLDIVDGPTESRDFQDATTLVISSQVLVKSRVVRLTKQVVHGTPAASPAIPATPAGYAPLAYVNVTAAHATTFNNNVDLVDARFPVGLRAAWIPASALIQRTGTMSYDITTGILATSGTGLREIVAIPHLPFNSRMISARFFKTSAFAGLTGSQQVFPIRRNSSGSTTVGSVAIGSIGAAVAGSAEGAFNLAVGNSSLEGPTWSTGFRHPMASNTIGDWESGGGAMYSATVSSGAISMFGCLIIYAGG